MNGKIYKITNTVNGDSYIGQTINEVTDRFSQHKGGIFQAKRNHSKLQKAMIEYGVNNFSVETIEENIETMAELSAKETYYIVQFGTKTQYNASFGGGPSKKRKSKSTPKNWMKKVEIGEAIAYHKDFNEFKYPKFKKHDWMLILHILKMIQTASKGTVRLYFDEIAKITGKLSKNPLEMDRFCNSFFSKSKSEINNRKLFESMNFQKDDYFVEFTINEEFEYIVGEIDSNFIFIEIDILQKLETYYSILLYKKLSEVSNENEWTVTLNDLRSELNCPESYITNAFNARIVNKSFEEMESVFENITLDKLKRGNKLGSYKFTFK